MCVCVYARVFQFGLPFVSKLLPFFVFQFGTRVMCNGHTLKTGNQFEYIFRPFLIVCQ
jgi:hypothetical protein